MLPGCFIPEVIKSMQEMGNIFEATPNLLNFPWNKKNLLSTLPLMIIKFPTTAQVEYPLW